MANFMIAIYVPFHYFMRKEEGGLWQHKFVQLTVCSKRITSLYSQRSSTAAACRVGEACLTVGLKRLLEGSVTCAQRQTRDERTCRTQGTAVSSTEQRQLVIISLTCVWCSCTANPAIWLFYAVCQHVSDADKRTDMLQCHRRAGNARGLCCLSLVRVCPQSMQLLSHTSSEF